MTKPWIAILSCVVWVCVVASLEGRMAGQTQSSGAATSGCGVHPPGPPPDRAIEPYANEPTDLRPFSKFTEPYDLNYIHPNIYSGAGRDIPDPVGVTEVRIGFLGPIENHPQQVFGLRMLHGAQLAVEEANARGGYCGKPFRLILHNDYDNWQANTVYGDERPTDPAIWGSASDEVVKMVYDDEDWAIFGSISSESTHIALRVALRAEIPIVNSASTDPTIPETYIPWFFDVLQDDRVQSFTLARRIFTELGLKRVAILRVNERYGRFGVPYFRDASRRLGHPVVIEQKFMPGDTDFARQLRVIQASRVDAIVLWTDEAPAAAILRQMRQMGMKQRVFGSYRTLGDTLLKEAGAAADGFEAVFPYDPTRKDPRWSAFQERFQARFHEAPEQFASLAYDAMNQLLDSIRKAGLNRARIHDALADIGQYEGVTGTMIYDPNLKNVSLMYIGTVQNGAITYRPASMEHNQSQSSANEETPAGSAKSNQAPPSNATPSGQAVLHPYARVGEDGVAYFGPRHNEQSSRANDEPVRIILFGADAANVAETAEVHMALRDADAAGTSATGTHWILLPIDSQQSWGKASAQLVQTLMDDHPLAILALDRDSAHLAEQMALKTFVPVIAICADKALTSTNIPWIFRLQPATSPTAAVRLIQIAFRQGGRSPDSLRAILASGKELNGVAFASTGEQLGY
ncbi:MAG TPA: ABC transporter substrate-binding protein [Terracidiphilus sp.]|nr:ABC transporter substrate-binding protein [Terracidiphilus sp.]